MLSPSAVLLFSGILLSPPEVADQKPTDSGVTAELNQYYEDQSHRRSGVTPNNREPWTAPLRQLTSADVHERRRASAHLCALLKRALADEQSGAARWQRLPYWIPSARNAARTVREQVVSSLSEMKPPPEEALPILRWYFDAEPSGPLQVGAMTTLAQVDGKEANALCIDLAVKPHDNSLVAVGALEQIAARKIAIPAIDLIRLCHHHRASIREAARALNKQQGGADPGNFDPLKAMNSPAIRKLLEQLAPLIVDLPPADAKFVEVEIPVDNPNPGRPRHKARGWLLKETEGSIELLTPFGERVTFGKAAQQAAPKQTMPKVTVLDIKDVVAQTGQIRASGNQQGQLSRRGMATGQFEGHGATGYEILLGFWLHTAHHDDLSARILLPALDTLYRDENLLSAAQHHLGQMFGYRMLVAFVGNRDYAEAERIARILADRFPLCGLHEEAVRLVEQLPKRKDDFRTLKLPTPPEWATLKKALSHPQQIDYLCRRLRLLNCFQMGQPGGVDFCASQYAEPCGITPDAAWGLNKGKTEVINPLVELAGDIDEFRPIGDKAKHGMDLTIADIPQLAPYLEDDWFVLSVSFWRDFNPDRNLGRTRERLIEIIDAVARQRVCTPEKLESDSTRADEIRRIIAWAKRHSSKNPSELLIEAIAHGLDAKTPWPQLRSQVKELLKLREKKAVPLFIRYLDMSNTNDIDRGQILSVCRRLDVAAVRSVYGKYRASGMPGLRLQAALIELIVGDRNSARQEIKRVFESKDACWQCTSELVEAVGTLLLEEGSKESRDTALRLIKSGTLAAYEENYTRAEVVQVFCAARMSDGFRFYLDALNTPGKRPDGTTIAEQFANEVATYFAPNEPAVQRIRDRCSDAAGMIPALKDWLQEGVAKPHPVRGVDGACFSDLATWFAGVP